MSPSITLDNSGVDGNLTRTLTKGENGTNGVSRHPISTPLPNPSLMVTADHDLKLEEAPVFAPGKGEVLLHIKCTGVCGYDQRVSLNMFLC
jgi:L-iditol 2-dehydrogenase